MFCRNCGNGNLPDNAAFCDKCGASLSAQQTMGAAPLSAEKLSKKDYFNSNFRTDGAKTRITIAWVVLALLALWVIANTVFTTVGVFAIMSQVDFDQDVVSILEQVGELAGGDMGMDSLYTEEDLALFEEFEGMTGVAMGSLFETILYIVFIVMAVFQILALVFLLLAVTKKSMPLAITGLVMTILFNSSILAIGGAIALLVIVNQLNKEYKQYSENYFMFTATQYSGNEPNFM